MTMTLKFCSTILRRPKIIRRKTDRKPLIKTSKFATQFSTIQTHWWHSTTGTHHQQVHPQWWKECSKVTRTSPSFSDTTAAKRLTSKKTLAARNKICPILIILVGLELIRAYSVVSNLTRTIFTSNATYSRKNTFIPMQTALPNGIKTSCGLLTAEDLSHC